MKSKSLYPWILVALLWGVGLLNYLDRQMLATMRPAMQSDIAALRSATHFGYLMGIFLWVYGLMSPVAGILADKGSKKWLIIVSLFIWSGVTLLMGYATSFTQLYVLRAVMGVSEALYLPTGLALIAEYHRDRTRSLAVGIHMTGLYLGTALGGFGATVAAAYTWHLTFQAFGVVGIAYALLLVFFLRDSPPPEGGADDSRSAEIEPFWKSWKVLLSKPSFWIILIYFAVPSLPGWATKNWLPTLFTHDLHMPMAQAGPMATITIALSQFFGVLGGGMLSDIWVRKNVRGRVYTGAIGLALTIPSLILMGFGHTLLHFITAGFCFGLGFGMFDANNMPILCQFVSPRYRASGYGLMNMFGVFSGAFITDLLGRYTDAGNLGRGFAMLAVVVCGALLLQLLFLRPRVNDFQESA